MCLAGNLNQLVPGSTKLNCVEIFDISRAGHDDFGRGGSRTEGIPILRLVKLPHQFLELGTEDIWFVIGLGSRASSKYTMVSVHTSIPHICHGRHGQCPCKFFLPGVNFYRFNAKNWQFTV